MKWTYIIAAVVLLCACKEPEEPKIPDTENVPSKPAEPEKWDVLDISE